MSPRNTGRGSRIAAMSPTADRFTRVKQVGGLFGYRPSLWRRIWSREARRAHRAARRAFQ